MNPQNRNPAPTSNFDALEFVVVSSAADSYGETDPYVDPNEIGVESIEPEHPANETATAGNTPAEAASESNGVPVILSEGAAVERPTVEIIPQFSAAETDSVELREPIENRIIETIVEIKNIESEPQHPPVAWFADAIPPEKPVDALEELASLPMAFSFDSPDEATSGGDAIYSVGDFSELADESLAAIRGCFEGDSDCFDHAVDPSSMSSGEIAEEPEPSTSHGQKFRGVGSVDQRNGQQISEFQVAADKLFMAEQGEEIKIDGDDGFDYIDLSCFDIRFAKFADNTITIADDQGTHFKIVHVNVPIALFADNVKVNLLLRSLSV